VLLVIGEWLFEASHEICANRCKTAHCRLNRCLFRIGLVDEAKYNFKEMARRLILSCPSLTDDLEKLCKTMGYMSEDVPHLLGGWSPREDAKTG
jgi:hypothetical protein